MCLLALSHVPYSTPVTVRCAFLRAPRRLPTTSISSGIFDAQPVIHGAYGGGGGGDGYLRALACGLQWDVCIRAKSDVCTIFFSNAPIADANSKQYCSSAYCLICCAKKTTCDGCSKKPSRRRLVEASGQLKRIQDSMASAQANGQSSGPFLSNGDCIIPSARKAKVSIAQQALFHHAKYLSRA